MLPDYVQFGNDPYSWLKRAPDGPAWRLKALVVTRDTDSDVCRVTFTNLSNAPALPDLTKFHYWAGPGEHVDEYAQNERLVIEGGNGWVDCVCANSFDPKKLDYGEHWFKVTNAPSDSWGGLGMILNRHFAATATMEWSGSGGGGGGGDALTPVLLAAALRAAADVLEGK